MERACITIRSCDSALDEGAIAHDILLYYYAVLIAIPMPPYVIAHGTALLETHLMM